jgi:hypothetical protein
MVYYDTDNRLQLRRSRRLTPEEAGYPSRAGLGLLRRKHHHAPVFAVKGPSFGRA